MQHSAVQYQTNPQPPQQVPVSQDEIYANVLQEERIKNLLEQLSPDNQLYEIEWRIKGYRRNAQTRAWEKIDERAPDISPLLVSRYVSYLSSILNQNTSMSNFSENQVNKMMKIVIEWLVDDLDVNADTYGIGSDYSERTRIGHIILNTTFAVLNRALNGQEARRMWGTMSLNESIGQQPKRGLADALKFWK